jgi:hypothetical protein
VAYTVKRLEGDVFGIWRDGEDAGTFELWTNEEDELEATYAGQVSVEVRAVVSEFMESYRQPFEGAAKRDA